MGKNRVEGGGEGEDQLGHSFNGFPFFLSFALSLLIYNVDA